MRKVASTDGVGLEHLEEVRIGMATSDFRKGSISWQRVAVLWFGLSEDASGAFKAYNIIRSLARQGHIVVDYDLYGIASIQDVATSNAASTRSRRTKEKLAPRSITIMNFHIGGNVGNINTGTLHGNMDASIKVLAETGRAELGSAIKQLFDAVSKAIDLSDDVKQEVLQQLAALSEQAAATPGKPENGRARQILTALGHTLSVAGSLASIWNVVGPQLTQYFGL
jgi:hypothetical protein